MTTTAQPTLTLHNFWRSSASHRVRIGLQLKGLAYDYVAVNLLCDDQRTDTHRAKNPMAQVPALEVREPDGTVHTLFQTLPILEYLDERWPEPPLLPRDPYLRARTRALAEIVNSGIQPLQNLPVLAAAKALGSDAATWVTPFMANGLAAFAKAAAETAGAFCVGDAPTIADCCLIPQLFHARRFKVDYSHHTQLVAIEQRCLALPAFTRAAPENQPDAVTT